jgi:hypothetical protein
MKRQKAEKGIERLMPGEGLKRLVEQTVGAHGMDLGLHAQHHVEVLAFSIKDGEKLHPAVVPLI